MTLGPLDEYLVHQIPDPVDHVYNRQPNFYDRYYFNLHSSGDELFLVTGLGQYPNLGVTDAFASISKGRHPAHRAFLAPAGHQPTRHERRPLRVEVVEGLRTLRVVCEPNEWGVAFDLKFEGFVRALEEPNPSPGTAIGSSRRRSASLRWARGRAF